MSDKEEQIKKDFDKACHNIKTCINLDNDTLLVLYGLFKQANEGNCNTSKPNFLDPKGQAKWTAWNENKDMEKQIAMRRYIRKVRSILGE
jgi:diazepam-binding inhibitor (GABA receptor modulating acyl-CoA-binding protein)